MVKLFSKSLRGLGQSPSKDLKLTALGIDAIEVSGGNGAIKSLDGKNKGAASSKNYGDKSKESYFKDFASKLAEEVDCSVILIGGNRTLEVMEDLMETTDIDFFSLARPLTAEPNLINLWAKTENTRQNVFLVMLALCKKREDVY